MDPQYLQYPNCFPEQTKVFASPEMTFTDDPVPVKTSQFVLSRNVMKNPVESPVYEYGKSIGDLDFLDYGAEEIVETHVEPDMPIQESLIGASVCSLENGVNTQGYSAPIQSVKQKFQKQVEPPYCVFENKDAGKHLAPRKDASHVRWQQQSEVLSQHAQVIPTKEQSFTQQLAAADKLMKGIGITIRPGGDGPLGIVHIRSTDSFYENPEFETEKPVDTFKSNEIVYGSKPALVDLVKYNEDSMFSSGVHGVYTDPSYKFLKWSHRIPEDASNLSVAQILGKGSFGSVELWRVKNGKSFVKKKIQKDKFCRNEVLLTMELQHPNILKMYGFIINHDYREIIMEYAGESLLAYSLREDRPEKIIWDVTYYALEGLSYLHDNNIIHFDIKPENICIKEGSEGLDVTIADLGSAQKIGESRDPKSMTYEYSSPELCRHYIQKRLPSQKCFVSDGNEEKRITGKVDIFALGLTVMFPYEKAHVMIKQFTGGLDSYTSVERPEMIRLKMTLMMAQNPNLAKSFIPANVGQNMRDVILGLIEGDHEGRLDANQAIELMRSISQKAESARQEEQQQFVIKEKIKRDLCRKVKQARRSSAGTSLENGQSNGKREKCQGVDLSRVTHESKAILEENSQLKNRVVRGLLKRKLVENIPSGGKQMKTNIGAENQNSEMSLQVEMEKPCNLPNLDLMF